VYCHRILVVLSQCHPVVFEPDTTVVPESGTTVDLEPELIVGVGLEARQANPGESRGSFCGVVRYPGRLTYSRVFGIMMLKTGRKVKSSTVFPCPYSKIYPDEFLDASP
jgi:hypothetical protein